MASDTPADEFQSDSGPNEETKERKDSSKSEEENERLGLTERVNNNAESIDEDGSAFSSVGEKHNSEARNEMMVLDYDENCSSNCDEESKEVRGAPSS